MYDVSTSEEDIAAGYPEWSESCETLEELPGVAERAARYGVPAHRLTVMEIWTDPEMGEQFDVIGSLEEVLARAALAETEVE